MNNAEFDALCQPVSNEARALYLLGLRPSSNDVTGLTAPLNYKSLLALLNSKSATLNRGRQINALIKELIAVNLVYVDDDCDLHRSLNGKIVSLPLRHDAGKGTAILQEKHALPRDWLPDSTQFNDVCALIGLVDTHYEDEELGEFIAYWLGRPDKLHTQYQWVQKFAQHLKRKRTTSGSIPLQQVGMQVQASRESAVEADDNAKRLVAKYKQSKNQD